ncbi:MAG: branched-chain amino acid ABC transporter permease [Rhodospirillales bacterium]|nr:branched-chain amino acid ABC transporter permease [Rhodospirillales bacterium]
MTRAGATFWVGAAAVMLLALAATAILKNEYWFYAGFVVLQFVVLATAWNILGGYAGYVNFGTSAFVGAGTYAAIVAIKALAAPLGVQILLGAGIAGLLGFATGLLTLRLRGIFFSIATVAVAIVLETFIVNWRFVGGSTGIQILRPVDTGLFGSYTKMLFLVMVGLSVAAAAIARTLEISWIGRGLRAVRDNEEAAESCGVPTLRLKLIACAISGALMGAAGAPMAVYQSYIEPASAFSLNYSILALAMPIVGGTAHWSGPVLGALLFGTLQQVVSATISSELNRLVIGVMLIVFVVGAPAGIVGLWRKWAAKRAGAGAP